MIVCMMAYKIDAMVCSCLAGHCSAERKNQGDGRGNTENDYYAKCGAKGIEAGWCSGSVICLPAYALLSGLIIYLFCSVLLSIAPQNGPEVDARSIYVGNVDYSVSEAELRSFFQTCGVVNRVTIGTDKLSGHPKGYRARFLLCLTEHSCNISPLGILFF